MKYAYWQLEDNPLVLCDAPEGAMHYQPALEACDVGTRILPATVGGWRACGRFSHDDRTRIVIFRCECEDTPADRLRQIREAADALPDGVRLQSGLMGIVLVGRPQTFKGTTYQYLSFFYLPNVEAWEALLPSYIRAKDIFMAKAPEGYPTEAALQLFDYRLRRFPMLE